MRIIKITEDLNCEYLCKVLGKELEENRDMITSKDCVITINIKPVIDTSIEKERLTHGKESNININNQEENNSN